MPQSKAIKPLRKCNHDVVNAMIVCYSLSFIFNLTIDLRSRDQLNEIVYRNARRRKKSLFVTDFHFSSNIIIQKIIEYIYSNDTDRKLR